MARSSLRAKPYVVEIQRHYHLDERTRKDKKGYPVRIHSNSRTSREEEIPRRKHPHLQPSKSNSLEYEDIYNQRNHLWENSHLKQQGRWSFRDDGGYGRVREHTRRSPGIARPTEIRVMINGEAGGTGHRERRNTDGTRYQNRTVGDNGPMRAKYEAVQTSTSREGTPKQNRVSKDKKDNQNEDLELWIARQTSFPRKQEETSNQRILGNDTTSHELVSNQSKSLQDNSNNGIPPQVSLKPPCPQTSRSASPTPSVRSNQSGGSRASHHSARSGTSEVSVVSIQCIEAFVETGQFFLESGLTLASLACLSG